MFSCSPRMQRMPGIRSSAATKCISEVPGLVKQVSTPQANKVCTRLSAPFIPTPRSIGGGTLRGTARSGNASAAGLGQPTLHRSGPPAMTTIMYPERMYQDDSEERRIFGPEVEILMKDAKLIADLPDAECARVDGLMLFRQWLGAADLARFPRLRAIVRMGVGYDRIDRATAAGRNVVVCNVPDYGTTEVADHAIALALALRRGLLWHHDQQRADPPAPWVATNFPLLKRTSVQTFGVLGLGRIGTAAAIRAKGLGFKVVFYDPYRPNGTELAIGIGRAGTLEELLRQSDVLSIHAPATPETRGMVGAAELALLPQDAVVVNTARGTILDIDAL